MKKNSTNKQQSKKIRRTTAQNLEARFNGGKDVLDYFNLAEGRILWQKNNTAQKLSSLRKLANNSHRFQETVLTFAEADEGQGADGAQQLSV